MQSSFVLDNVTLIIPSDLDGIIDVHSEEYDNLLDSVVLSKCGREAITTRKFVELVRKGFTVVDEEGEEI